MKKNKLLKLIGALLFFVPLHLFAQQETIDITGLWKGQLYNDTTKQYLSYEIAISDDDGKLTGYSYTVFKGDKGDETGVKTIKVKRLGDKIIIEDISLIDNSYIVESSVKRVRKLMTLTLTVKDSIMVMSGTWITNWVGKYNPVTGSVEVQKKNNTVVKDEPLIKRLDAMKLSKKLSFYQPEKKDEQITVAKTQETTTAVAEKPVKKIKKKEPEIIAAADSSKTTAIIKPVKTKKKEAIIIPPPAAEAAVRKTETTQTIDYESDSLVLTIYDNGIVDGDTVSIVMNNSLIFAKAGLSEKPITKTIYTKDIPDSLQLIWYAENLGSIPPNTGLLIIMDGKIRHEVFFSADLQTNAAIILRRKKKTG
jgi:hypothetical protein